MDALELGRLRHVEIIPQTPKPGEAQWAVNFRAAPMGQLLQEKKLYKGVRVEPPTHVADAQRLSHAPEALWLWLDLYFRERFFREVQKANLRVQKILLNKLITVECNFL